VVFNPGHACAAAGEPLKLTVMRRCLPLLAFCFAATLGGAADAAAPNPPLLAKEVAPAKDVRIYVIPVRDEINSAVLYVVRRGLKEAIEAKADAVVLDMRTPGGSLGTTLEIMEALQKFSGPTITYVNDQALSAGAFISATTDEIWFAPRGKIGAAAPVSSGGQDIDKTMRSKVVSFLRAEVRSVSEGKGHRGAAISAMIDEDYELKIDDKVIKPKGELLTLTATEAMATYGEPPAPLLGAGIVKSVDELVAKRFPGAKATVTTLHQTWSEELAVWLNTIAPALLGLGLLALFIEFKTPGFGVFGIVGIVCLAIVFLSNYVAGFSGHEPILVFLFGLLLLALEIFFFPGIVVMALAGLALMLGALVWSMADLWPNEPLSIAWSGDVFVRPLANLGIGLLIAVGLGIGLARFLPRGWVWDKLVVQSTVGGAAQIAGGSVGEASEAAALVGREGVAATALRPSGQVEIGGRHYEARVEVGAIERGRAVVVRSYSDFGLIVEEIA
jgi:membrane-bound serine protease (ClpP class)